MRRTLLSLSILALFSIPALAAEPSLPWLDQTPAARVDCGRTILDLIVAEPIDREPNDGGPVNTSDPNCICPSPVGLGWKMLFDDCVYHPETTFCTGRCYWDNPIRHIGTTTPCGSP
ncbi:MAG TPA: hypothetical protein VN783_15285 [Thermoanaerobaculia bacterium]|nr:hypothetical protein [Thermoanaerobaculia bacterium]